MKVLREFLGDTIRSFFHDRDVRREIRKIAGSAGSTPLVQSATVTLTDAQIKTLPTTPVTIVAAAGAGKVIIPLSGFVSIDASAGAYTGITDASLILHDTSFNYFSSPTPVEIFLGAGYATPTSAQIGCPFLNTPTSGTFVDIALANQPMISSTIDNSPLQVSDNWAGLSDYGGGNAANTMKVTVHYVIIDL